jgi:hypothetical protein
MLNGTVAQVESCPALTPVVTEDLRFADLRGMASDLSEIDQVIAPLFGKGFDAFELILLLGEAKFRGRLCVMADDLPHRGMILRELRVVADPLGIDVDLRESRRPAEGLAAKVLRRLRG